MLGSPCEKICAGKLVVTFKEPFYTHEKVRFTAAEIPLLPSSVWSCNLVLAVALSHVSQWLLSFFQAEERFIGCSSSVIILSHTWCGTMENDIWKQALHIARATACMEGTSSAAQRNVCCTSHFLSSLGWFHKVFLFLIFFCAVWRGPWPQSRLFYHPWLPPAVPQRTLSHNQRQPDHICWEDSNEKKDFFFTVFLVQNSSIVVLLDVAAKVFVVHFQSVLSVVLKFRKSVPQVAWVKTTEQTKWLLVCCWHVAAAVAVLLSELDRCF